VVDLGSDRVWRYTLDVDELTVEQLPPLVLPAGFGPRQIVVEPDHAYVLGELSSQLAVFAGTELVAVIPAFGSALPAGNLAATLLSPQPGQLLVSHRGADRICLFSADRDSVELETEFSSEGAGPRHVAVVDGRLFVADQLSDLVASRTADGGDVLTAGVPNPTCILPLG
jgi:6-phosphogluconolactonase (cycloisomerase 2 family)